MNKTLSRFLGTAAFIVLIALGAFIRIPLPFSPVPLTLQTFFVILSGAFLGRALGLAAISGYILLGISGVPLFTLAGSGLLYFAGPTAGYLFGFLAAGLITGTFSSRIKSTMGLTFLFFVSGIVILLCGTLWLKVFLKLDTTTAFLLGFLPFLPGDTLKAAVAAVIRSKIRVSEPH